MPRRLLVLTTLACAMALGACQRQTATSAAPAVPASAASPVATPPQEAAPATVADASVASAQDAYLLAATGSGFSTGPMMSAHTVYVFFDTTCPHCAHLWQAAQSLGNQLKVVWIPVAFLRPQSLPQGATILAASDAVAAMNENETSVAGGGRGITVSPTVSDEAQAKVRANTSLFKQLQSDSVPLIVYRNAKTGEVGQQPGAVTAPQLLALAGL